MSGGKVEQKFLITEAGVKNFTFELTTKIFFGRGQARVIGEEIKKRGGSRVLICYGSNRIKDNGLFDTVTLMLERAGLDWTEIGGVRPNPRIDLVRKAVKKCKVEGVDYLLAVGGGSVIDTAKTVAAGVFIDKDPWEMFVGKAQIQKALPVGVVLTLAATGSEMNGNAVISNLETTEKNAIHSPLIRPRFSFLDPIFTYTVPPYHTAAGVADIMSHCFEQYFSPENDTYLVDRMTEAVLKTCIHYGPIAMKRGEDYEARANLLWAGSLALNDILSTGKTGDWACHQIEHAVSAVFDVIHGAGLAVIFPHWMESVLSEETVDKFKDYAVNVWGAEESGNAWEIAKEGIEATVRFFKSMEMPTSLSEFGVKESDLDLLAEKATRGATIGKFCELDRTRVREILKKAL